MDHEYWYIILLKQKITNKQSKYQLIIYSKIREKIQITQKMSHPSYDPDLLLTEPESKQLSFTSSKNYNYNYNTNSFFRKIVFLHTIRNMWDLGSKIQGGAGVGDIVGGRDGVKQLKIQDIPDIMPQDHSLFLTKKALQTLHTISNYNCKSLHSPQSQALLPTPIPTTPESCFTSKILLSLIWHEYKNDMISVIILFSLDFFTKILFSVLLAQLIARVREGDIGTVYILTILSGPLLYIGQLGRHNGFYITNLFATRLRTTLIFLLYSHLSRLSSHTARTQSLGKITNLLSSDFNSLQLNIIIFLTSASVPVGIVGVIALLVYRFGWPGMIIAGVVGVVFGVQIAIGRVCGGILRRANGWRDQRVKATTEFVEGVKLIKLYGWQTAFKNSIQELRDNEVQDYKKIAFGRSVQKSIGNVASNLAAFICFLTIALTTQQDSSILTSSKIFSTMQLMGTLKLLLSFLTQSFNCYYDVKILLERLCSVLNIRDVRMRKIDTATKEIIIIDECLKKKSRDMEDQGVVVFENVRVYWKIDEATLCNINLNIKKGQFIGITGRIGAGKSALLSAMLGEIPYYSGSITINGSIGYVEQEAIIFSGTIKDNILFGQEYDQQRYNNVLQMSCLSTDLKILDNGDNTIVGQRGITLSGGQKARLTLARALYSNPDIYLLDDPISAVDSKVAKQIYENCILKLRGLNKTIILVTHQISYLYGCDRVAILEGGTVVGWDTPGKLMGKLRQIQMAQKKKQQEQQEQQEQQQEQNDQTYSHASKTSRNSSKSLSISIKPNPKSPSPSPLRQQQTVTISIYSYTRYLFYNKINNFLFPIAIIFFILADFFNVMFVMFLAKFEEVYGDSGDKQMRKFWIGLGLFLLGYFISNILKYFLLYCVVLNSNKTLHNSMLASLTHSPCSYFDTTPTGQLTAKFSNDLSTADKDLALPLMDSIQGPIAIFIILSGIGAIDGWYLGPGVVNFGVSIGVFLYAKRIMIASKQLDLKYKSPVFSAVRQMLLGLIQIRIFKRRPSLLRQFSQKIDRSLKCTLNNLNLSRAFSVILNYFSILMLWFAMMIGAFIVEPSTAALYGVSIVFISQINERMQQFLKQIVLTQSAILSTARILGLVDLPHEKSYRNQYDDQIRANDQEGTSYMGTRKQWPQKATIKIENLSMRYRPDLPLVLNKINLEIKDREKIGIVGRTGAGKSSIIQALFHICQPEQGSIYEFGGYDALKMGLHTLRQSISVIPQSPFLFRGTIKRNLDPLEMRSDKEIWEALQGANLKQTIEAFPDRLRTDITNIAQTFSAGQKQLLCLARALLQNNPLLVLDQATSNTDIQTDHLIQQCIKIKFKNTTIITIAHRLNTIANYDRVVVMERGKIVEVGAPWELIRKEGLFAGMVQHTGKNAEIIKKIAREAYERKGDYQ